MKICKGLRRKRIGKITRKEKIMARERKVFKLKHLYQISNDNEEYIESNRTKEEIGDLLSGFQFYLNENTILGRNCDISLDAAAWFLSTFYECRRLDKKKKQSYTAEEIDILIENEKRFNKDLDKYILKIDVASKPKEFFDFCNIFNSEDLIKLHMDPDWFRVQDILNGKINDILNSNIPSSEKKQLLIELKY